VPDVAASASPLHGPLMVCGFFGVVISLERAVAIGRSWAYLGPLLAGLGTVAALLDPGRLSRWLFVGASLVLLVASLDIFRRQRASFTLTMALGAACWCAGNALWATGAAIPEVSPWWLAFLILTIGGERLELSRFMPPSPMAKGLFAVLLVGILVGLLAIRQSWGTRMFAAGLLGLAAWLLKQDIARRTVRQRGLTRFIAVCLLSGYAWLAVGAAVLLDAGRLVPGSAAYDATLHALALGFVFSMVFGHAPIIFPAVLRVSVPYHASFYLQLLLMECSLALRLAGDASGRVNWTRSGGLLGAVALACFVATTLAAALRGWRAERRRAG